MFIETVTGKLVNPADPDPNNIDIHDIAWALSRIPRFAGHTITEIPYNVAQHSVYVCQLLQDFYQDKTKFTNVSASLKDVSEKLNLIESAGKQALSDLFKKALLHDAHETYIGDVPSPVKRIPELYQTFKILEMKLDHAIYTKFGLSEATEDEKYIIKFFDKLAQAIESYQFMPSRGNGWNLPSPTLVLIHQFPAPTTPLKSYKAFMDTFEFLSVQ